ncbi:MAG: low specificity L-threonine aldolase [Acidobacteria bacterium]|nr:MAG: low specificity L-threonine aldolase [Acidobacteriota bacterium]
MDLIDLRSDTVTKPDAEMRRAMAEAEVGDDVFSEDPTVNRLEEEAAAAVGMEAALFVPSGTMGNQIALHLHARPGGEVICDARCHIVNYEIGGMAALSGLLPRALPSPDGLLDPAAVEAAIAPDVSYRARTVLIEVENSHMMAGGTVNDRPHLEAILAVARRHRLPVHFDGARVFNAAAALGVSVASLAAGFDSLNFCLSKGLGAPVGSLLCGSRAFITEGRRVRKMLGGGMRQAGILAAAGLIALRKGPAQLPEDHENAARLARALAGMKGIDLDPASVRTNIVIFRLTPELCGGSAMEFLVRAKEVGVLAVPMSQEKVRFITHRDVSRGQIEEAIERVARL